MNALYQDQDVNRDTASSSATLPPIPEEFKDPCNNLF